MRNFWISISLSIFSQSIVNVNFWKYVYYDELLSSVRNVRMKSIILSAGIWHRMYVISYPSQSVMIESHSYIPFGFSFKRHGGKKSCGCENITRDEDGHLDSYFHLKMMLSKQWRWLILWSCAIPHWRSTVAITRNMYQKTGHLHIASSGQNYIPLHWTLFQPKWCRQGIAAKLCITLYFIWKIWRLNWILMT